MTFYKKVIAVSGDIKKLVSLLSFGDLDWDVTLYHHNFPHASEECSLGLLGD